MLCGPERFFRNAKAILPWNDEDDSPLGHRPAQTGFCTVNECKRLDAVHNEQQMLEHSPFTSLPRGWGKAPLSFGITISVVGPSSGVGKILRHCKDHHGMGNGFGWFGRFGWFGWLLCWCLFGVLIVFLFDCGSVVVVCLLFVVC